jgi:hypothetical protein
MGGMSRLRRLVVSDRWFFITCRLLPQRQILSESEFALLTRVIPERREEHSFLLTAWVFLPDHGHEIVYPPLSGLAAHHLRRDGIDLSRRDKAHQPFPPRSGIAVTTPLL